MAIYRPPKPRWPLTVAAGALGVVLGLVAGLTLGREDLSPQESVAPIKTALVAAAGSLEVAAVEYEESVDDGQVTRQAEYEGALSALASSRATYEEVRSALVSLVPGQVVPIDALYDKVEQLMETRADESEVVTTLEELEVLLKGHPQPGGTHGSG